MSESVSALAAPRAPDDLQRGLPIPPLPESALRVPRVHWLPVVSGTVAFVGIVSVGVAPALTAATILLAVVALVAVRQTTAGFVKANDGSLALLIAGRSDEAVAGFTDLARRSRMATRKSLALYNLGYAESRRGNLERALSLWASVHLGRALDRSPLIKHALPFQMAQAYARLGDVTAARLWLGEARRRKPPPANLSGEITEALILLREGRIDEAEAVFATHWRSFENGLQGELMRDLRVLRAFAAKALSKPTTEWLAPLRPKTPGALSHLGACWPEMQGAASGAGLED